MNKKILIPLIILTSFFFISNVKASSKSYNIKQSEFEKLFYDKSNLNDNENEYLKKAYEYFNVDFENDYYIALLYRYSSKKSVIIYKWSKNSTYIKPLSLGVSLCNNSYDSILLYLNTNETNSFIEKYYSLTDGTIGSGSGMFHSKGLNLRGVSINQSLQILETNSAVLFTETAYNDSFYNPYKYLNINNDDDDLCLKTFSNGDIIFNSNGINIQPPKPEITFKEIEKGYEDETKNKLLFHKISINFSVYDTEKYIYFYRTSLQNDKTWSSISNNNFQYTAFSDQTLYVAIIDRKKYEESVENGQELVFDYIVTSTYTFDKLSSTIPELSFNASIPDSCYMTLNGKKEIVCKNLNIKISNYNNLNKYLWEYSIGDSQNFKPTYSNNFTLYLDNNVTIYFRLLDREKNEYIKYLTYNTSGITTNLSSIGPYVNLHGEYKEKEYYYEMSIYYYNYNSNLYNYYYSVDREKWTEINPIDLSIYSSNSTNQTYYNQYKIYQDCTFYLKIEDKNGNFINGFSYQVDFTKKIEETDKQDNFLTKIFDSAKQKFPIFDQMYNLYKTYLGMEFKDEKPPIPKVNLSFLGINQEYEVIDYTFYDKYRDTAFDFVKLGLSIYTMLKLYRIVKSYFGGGK